MSNGGFRTRRRAFDGLDVGLICRRGQFEAEQ
jgi:hypothetical protein